MRLPWISLRVLGEVSVARSVRKNFRCLSMRQIKVLARAMGKSESMLIKELIRCDVPCIANAFNV